VTPKGHRRKDDYDRKSGLFGLKTLLPDGMSFPLEFGFIPSTLAEDGDPTDVMILADEPSPVGALLDVRLLGVVQGEEREEDKVERNDRQRSAVAAGGARGSVGGPSCNICYMVGRRIRRMPTLPRDGRPSRATMCFLRDPRRTGQR
jgi:hypothetical protein